MPPSSTLPDLPAGFGMAGSPYPPHSTATSKPSAPPPATPPAPPRVPTDSHWRHPSQPQQHVQQPRSVSSQYPQSAAPPSTPSFTPGQLITPQFSSSPPSNAHAPRAASYNFTSAGRALSPAPPSGHYGGGPPQTLPGAYPSTGPHSGFRVSSPQPPPPQKYYQPPPHRATTPQPQSQYDQAPPPPHRATTPQPQSQYHHPPSQYPPSHLQPQPHSSQFPHPRRASAAPSIPTAMPSATSAATGPPPPPPPSSSSALPQQLAKPMTDLPTLTDKRERALASGEERVKLNWARLVVKYVEREHGDAMSLKDPQLVRYVDEAMAVVNRRANATPPDLDALFLRGELRASGNFPSYHRKDPKNAFNDFEYSGRMGYPPSWFRIGRDYETLDDVTRALDAYDRGRGFQDVGCIYRLGMAHLLGQINVKQDHAAAMQLLREAADLANDDTPQPAYIYGMLFAGEFAHLNIPAHLLTPPVDQAKPHLAPSSERTAMRYIERAAYLNFAPAQYKLGWAYEYAQLDAAFDPLLSVQYYSLASKGGEVEADMAVSKWFLCGAEGCFDKNEDLAYTFAEKAARKGLPTAEFALAYYSEVGVGCTKNITTAKKWYKKAAAHGNQDAKDRLEALQNDGGDFTRKEYEAQLESRLTRKHTAAQKRSLKEGRGAAAKRANDAQPSTAALQSGFSQMSVGGGAGGSTAAAPAPARAPSPAPPGAAPQVSRQRTLKMVNEAARAPDAPPLPPPTEAGRPMPMPMPMPTPAIASMSTIPSPAPSPAPSRIMSPGPTNGSQMSTPAARARMPSASVPSGMPMSPGPRPGGSGLSQRPRPSNGAGSGPMHPGLSQQHQQAYPNHGRRPSASEVSSSQQYQGSANASSSSSAAAADAKKYYTFAEMGFESKAGKDDKDCVVM